MAVADQVERVFLGGDGPALPAAADWLVDALGDGLGEALVAVPGAQAQRRLMELLADRSAGRALVPPTVVTLGALVDRLLPGDGLRVAGDLDALLAWAGVLREAEPAVVKEVLPQAPSRDDWPGWWSLAAQVQQAADELGAQLVGVNEIAGRTTREKEVVRWQALGTLSDAYAQRLAEQGLIDRHVVRLDAIENGSCDWSGHVVLIATADLQPVHVRSLACVDAPVTALIAANTEDAEGFDAFGGLVTAYWSERTLSISDEAIAFVDGPGDQADAVLRVIDGWASKGGLSVDQVTVGLGDESLAGPIGRSLALAGVPVRTARGDALSESRPIQLLQALAAFADGLRFDALAALLRHPDVEQAVTDATGSAGRPWLTLLDRYAGEHLAVRPMGGWLGDRDQVDAMDAVYQAARALLPVSPGALRPLGAWADAIGDALAKVYGGRALNRFSDHDRQVVTALEAVGGVLERFESLQSMAQPHCTYAQAVTLLITQLRHHRIPDPGGKPAVELVGYLELLLDDAPKLVIAGMNEPYVPAPPRHSALLSEGLRRELGMPGDERRLARDGYALSAMLAWRNDAQLIVGRRSRDGDPLLPSRLMMQTGDAALAQRVSRFVGAEQVAMPRSTSLLTPGDRDRFLVPRPTLPPEPINQLRVTAFRDYLACPYRFYLKHVLGLEPIDDRVTELSAGGFGTLAHQALRALASEEMVSVDDSDAIAARLSAALDDAFTKDYGKDPPIAARVQAEQLRYRLSAIAYEHARLVRAGWRIEHAEVRCKVAVEVDGHPFIISGQIDRIDLHADGRRRVIDYKTSETAKQPGRMHRQRVDGEWMWVDLQLPLYLDLCASLGVGPGAEMGYLNLPKKSADTGLELAKWDVDELREAREVRDDVIRAVRQGVYWPPKQPPVFDDGLGWLCGDHVADRPALIKASSAGSKGGGV